VCAYVRVRREKTFGDPFLSAHTHTKLDDDHTHRTQEQTTAALDFIANKSSPLAVAANVAIDSWSRVCSYICVCLCHADAQTIKSTITRWPHLPVSPVIPQPTGHRPPPKKYNDGDFRNKV
jgi:hypothetical protein